MELRSEYNEYRISVPKEFENIFTHFTSLKILLNPPLPKRFYPLIRRFCYFVLKKMQRCPPRKDHHKC